MKRRILGALALALPLAYVGTGPAYADQCSHDVHCYGLVQHSPGGNINAYGVELWTNCLHLDNDIDRLSTHETWMPTNPTFPHSAKWIEAGYIKGEIAGDDDEHWFRYFWGEYDGSTFYSHFINYAPVSTWTNFSFYRQSNGKWQIWLGGLGGTQVGTTVQSAYGVLVQAGAETTTDDVYSHGKARYIQWRKADTGQWHWATSPQFIVSPMYTVTGSGATMEQWSNVNVCAGETPPTSFSVKKSPTTESKAVEIARGLAKRNGDSNPRIEKPTQRMQKGESVYNVTMKGKFSADMFSRPHGAPVPTGDTMTVQVNRDTGALVGVTIGHGAPRLPAETSESDSNKIVPRGIPSHSE